MSRPAAVAFTYAEFLLSAVAFVPLIGAARLRSRSDPTYRLAGRWLRNFGKVTSGLTPLWDFTVEGNPPPDIDARAYVVVCNHESNADPFLLSWLPWDMRWISKEELFRLPLLGALMRMGGDIALRRGDSESVRDMFAECRTTLEGGLSVMIFPEGTRSRDGALGAFKSGAFQLAIEAGVPVLPLALAGTRACLPTGSGMLGEARAVVRILPPVQTLGLSVSDVEPLKQIVRGEIESAVQELRERVRA
ncbi:MAG: 1-acyl-sn-glycerol-3-phosphate acyltransferase [Myxococcaceae bacterium]|nr:1-acyl-sn-glycerol-3-phosphate acyltransferase [Myxococcaceae bacterium]